MRRAAVVSLFCVAACAETPAGSRDLCEAAEPLVHVAELEFGFTQLAARRGEYGLLGVSDRFTRYTSDAGVITPAEVEVLDPWPDLAADEAGTTERLGFAGTDEGFVSLARRFVLEPGDVLQRRVIAGGSSRFDAITVEGRVLAAEPVGDGLAVAVAPIDSWLEPEAITLTVTGEEPRRVPVSPRQRTLRLFPRAGALAYRPALPDAAAAVWAELDGVARDTPACDAGAPLPPGTLSLAAAGDSIYVARACRGEVRVARSERGGEGVASAVFAADALSVGSAVAVETSGHVLLALWRDGAPAVHVLDPITLADVRAPLVLPPLEACSNEGILLLAADPELPGRFALHYSAAIGHGTGCAKLARVSDCNLGD